jgi:hypothetical protein
MAIGVQRGRHGLALDSGASGRTSLRDALSRQRDCTALSLERSRRHMLWRESLRRPAKGPEGYWVALTCGLAIMLAGWPVLRGCS